MQITLRIGEKTVSIEKDWEELEDQVTWIELMEEMLFPAIRGFGYVIDDEFINSLDEIHQEYLDKKYKIPWRRNLNKESE
jgi:hypothetical protein